MIQLFDVNEENWLELVALRVRQEQEKFLARPVGILARGYVYRACRARVIGIANDGQTVGVALVRDMDEEPACYDLQQFMIDERFQNKGYGTKALRLILALLGQEGKYADAEVCVNKENAAALRMYENVGFIDTGYIDENLPDCLNLMYHFRQEHSMFSSIPISDFSASSGALISDFSACSDTLISDFSTPLFQDAFRQYFSEIGVSVNDWDGLFAEMNNEGDNLAFVRTDRDGKIIGFLQFKPTKFTSWFFEETCGFIREFWIASAFRRMGHGTALLALAENHFRKNNIFTSILTTDSAARFYEKHGYEKAAGCKAKNGDRVFTKRLK